MAGGFRFRAKVVGVEAAVRSLDEVKRGVRTRVLRKATTKAAQPVAKEARRNAPVRSRQLRRSIGYRVRTYPSGVVLAAIGPRAGFRTTYAGRVINPTKYAHLVELGTRRGVAPRLFLRRAWESHKAGAAETMRREIAEGVAREAAKAAARGKSILA